MRCLLDVNILLALAHQSHADHEKVGKWFQSVISVAKEFNTCSITELGFVRVSVQAGLASNILFAQETLAGLKRSSRIPFVLIGDSLGGSDLPKYVKSHSQLTDGHLLELAKSVGARLVTLDRGIPGALLAG